MLDGHPSQLGELVDGSFASKATVTAGLDAAERHLWFVMDGWAIDVANTRLNLLSQRQGARSVSTENGCGKSER